MFCMESSSAHGRIAAAVLVTIQRLKTYAGIVGAICDAEKGITPLRGVAEGIVSIGPWTDRSGQWQKRKAGERVHRARHVDDIYLCVHFFFHVFHCCFHVFWPSVISRH